MTLADIERILNQHITGGNLILPADALGSATIQTQLQLYFVNGQLIINAANVSIGQSSVRVTGSGQTVLSGTSVQADFLVIENNTEISLTATAQADWTLATAFPMLVGTLLETIAVSNASLLLQSSGTQPGLSFSGTLAVSDAIGGVADLLGSALAVPFSGPISMAGQAPVFDFTTPVKDSLSVGVLKKLNLSLSLSSQAKTIQPFPGRSTPGQAPEQGVELSLAFKSTLNFKTKSKTIPLPIEMDLSLGTTLLRFAVGLTALSKVALDDFTDWVNGVALSGRLPDSFDPGKAVSIDLFEFIIDPKGPKLLAVSVGVSSAKDWKIVKNVTVTDIDLVFTVADPMGSKQAMLDLSGAVALGKDGQAGKLDARASLPDFILSGGLASGSQIDLALLLKTFLPAVSGVPQLSIDDLDFFAQPSSASYAMLIALKGNWPISIGHSGLTIKALSLQVESGRDAGVFVPPDGAGQSSGTPAPSSINGRFYGEVHFGKNSTLTALIKAGSDFEVEGTLSSISLTRLIKKLASDIPSFPKGFNLTLDNSHVLIERGGGIAQFALSTQINKVDSFGFVVKKQNGQWGFAFGISLASLQDVPGLSGLKRFEDAFQFQEIALIASSFNLNQFKFPILAAATPVVPPQGMGGSFNMPSGFTVMTAVKFNANKGSGNVHSAVAVINQYLQNWDLSAGLVITVAVPDPLKGSSMQLVLDVNNEKKNIAFQGALFAVLNGSQSSVGLSGEATFIAHKTSLEFGFDLSASSTGASASGALLAVNGKKGIPWKKAFGIQKLTLSDLFVELGIDDAGVPTLGFGGSIDIKEFDGSIAVLFNSKKPTQSLLAGSVSDTTLEQIVNVFSSDKINLSNDEKKALKKIGIKGASPAFSIGVSLAKDLNAKQVTDHLRTQFLNKGQVNLSDDPRDTMITVGKKGRTWFLTDKRSSAVGIPTHYALTFNSNKNKINVSQQAQLYIAPETINIGPINAPVRFKKGYKINGELDVFEFKSRVFTEFDPGQGVIIDASMSVLKALDDLLIITRKKKPDKGPKLSLSTFKDAHFFIEGEVTFLGVEKFGLEIQLNKNGLKFDIEDTVNAVAIDLAFQVSGLKKISGGGSADFKIDKTLDLGFLGKVPLKRNSVSAKISFAYHNKLMVTSKGDVKVKVLGKKSFDVTVKAASDTLKDMPSLVWNDIKNWSDDLKNDLGEDVSLWVKAVEEGVLEVDWGKILVITKNFLKNGQSLSKVAEEYIKIMSLNALSKLLKDLNIGANDVAKLFKNDLGIKSALELANALLAAHSFAVMLKALASVHSIAVVVSTLDKLDQSANDIAKSLQKYLEFSALDIGNALLNIHSIETVTKALLKIHSIKVVVQTLGRLDQSANDIAKILRKELDWSIEETFKAMDYIHSHSVIIKALDKYSKLADIVKAMFGPLGISLSSIIKSLKDADYALKDILKATVGLTQVKDLVKAVRKAGFSLKDLLKAGALGILGVSVYVLKEIF